ncbi:MAG: DMT family protein [Thermogemmata sp.]|jgi:uncharacterized protein (DUF486 family)|uniref:DMT family protein n=1 Tax=Thermogemmata fonticola TaxID=2755323 RepID=A0A7V8VGE0_9BACT|nr:DMT family protein [Thermogemmata fonticola]MBA2227569.1 DMT family protein [Thermogemmata fonticola]MCX8138970.1 DMT family protein [Gemmataceae bacterium]
MYTALLLIASNTFMTIAWYGHLKYKDKPLWIAILVSWCIALPEYALQVPANRIGHRYMSATQLKVMQEVISLTVFMLFAWWYFGEQPTWRTLLAFVLITLAVALVRGEHGAMAAPPPVPPPPDNTPVNEPVPS